MAYDHNIWILMVITVFSSCNVYGEILTHCGDEKISVGDSHSLSCSDLPSDISNGINVFHDGDIIISCNKDNKTCTSTDAGRYTLISPHTEFLNFTITSIQSTDAGKYICADSASKPDEGTSKFCTLEVQEDGLKDGEIAGIVIGTIVLLLFVVLISYALIMKKCVIPKRGG
ncbi:hypothetical protein LOTGIDRAFT_237380 [Lottia gigantea]|uniref:Immunoglobulin subtype domain-containing protein n=1 Tax=Lottia gigantea TaxID=225164 RepID=V4BAD5_LOTGI|nr:hypothetical protein LOTGIDRAFT_237380 [Lottia gigantea]ESP04426.1 hypothetical protein LOTGIDRAFT_237380 [Lottia gigantea]